LNRYTDSYSSEVLAVFSLKLPEVSLYIMVFHFLLKGQGDVSFDGLNFLPAFDKFLTIYTELLPKIKLLNYMVIVAVSIISSLSMCL
jgi:hypothetical protein